MPDTNDVTLYDGWLPILAITCTAKQNIIVWNMDNSCPLIHDYVSRRFRIFIKEANPIW